MPIKGGGRQNQFTDYSKNQFYGGPTITQKLLDQWKIRRSCHDRLLLASSTNIAIKEQPFSVIFLALNFKVYSGSLF